ncbi:DMT family transporter [Chelativorans sp. YIM 93263]|uniref:DMT family transporter n=1 Tax=Chelativorans sp. YIM 93263 TaxID=2906648 RepID=UPI00237941D4|nr:multidrug efflux SMR transporter [Chelativorans sp. YIM 93263]
MNPALITYGSLAIAIVFEVIGTSFLQQSQQFTRLLPTAGMAVCYAGAFYFLSISLKAIPVGVAYAIWSGLGVVLISIIGVIVFKQTLDWAALIGLGLIVLGVVVVNGFSDSISH